MNRSSGNALFLVLIAVVLFAALSYAITQTGRGGGTASKEQALIDAAVITQYGANARIAVDRMIFSGVSKSAVQFCLDSDFDSQCGLVPSTFATVLEICDDASAAPENCLFTQAGGGVLVQLLPATAQPTASNQNNNWVFIEPVGTGALRNAFSGIGTAANDGYMTTARFAGANFGVSLAVCQAINVGLGLGTAIFQENIFDQNVVSYPGEIAFCLDGNTTASTAYFYFHVLVEM